MTILGAQDPQCIIKLFTSNCEESTKTGKYNIKLFVDGIQKEVVIDDYFPCANQDSINGIANENNLLVTSFQHDKIRNRKIIWPMLVEKAIAKVFGSYEHLNGGAIDEALMMMTGMASFRFNLLSEDIQMKIADNSLWEKMKDYSDKRFFMGAGSLPKEFMPSPNLGVVPTHAYAILEVIECDNNKLIELKNPWGESFWTGDWSESSNKWTRRIRGKVASRNAAHRKQDKKKQKAHTTEGSFVTKIFLI